MTKEGTYRFRHPGVDWEVPNRAGGAIFTRLPASPVVEVKVGAGELPADLELITRLRPIVPEVKSMLEEYAAVADGRIILEHVIPEEDKEKEEEAIELDMQQDNAYVFSEHNGLLEPCVALGDEVSQGDLIAKVYPTERTGIKPVEYFAGSDGIIMGRHYPSLIKIGDFMNVIARPVN